MTAIDLNSDLGESFGAWRMGDDEAMLRTVSSANIACGFHAGDAPTMRATCAAAAANGVAIGAHVSYPDLAGFGRRAMSIAADELRDLVLYQIGALDAFARSGGSRVSYVKPHGALYHDAAGDQALADAVVDALSSYDPLLAVLGPPGSELERSAARVGVRSVGEAFADRGYLPDGSLVPRGRPGAVLDDVAAVAERTVRLATDGTVVGVDGSVVRVAAESICVHGDTPGAVAMAAAAEEALVAAGVTVASFAVAGSEPVG